MNKNLVWLNNANSLHTYGIEILSLNKEDVKNFVYDQVVPLCKRLNCNYFIQGYQTRDFGISWAFVEFFGEGSEDKILEIIEKFNDLYGQDYYNSEIMLDEPDRKLLVELGLF